MKKAGITAICVAAAVALGPATASAKNLGSAGDFTYVKKTSELSSAPFEPRAGKSRSRCSHGSRPVGGGATTTADPETSFLGTLVQSRTTWLASAWHTDDPTASITSYAVCPRHRISLSHPDSYEVANPGPANAGARAECKNGSVLGGGVVLVGDPKDWWLNSTEPVDGPDGDAKPDDAWQIFAEHTEGSKSGSLVAHATCADVKTTVRSTSTTLKPGSTLTMAAMCPRGKVAVSGGGFLSGSAASAWLTGTSPWDSADKGKTPEDGWSTQAHNDSSANVTFAAIAVCA